MVLLTYKGQNFIYFGTIKIVPGINDISDDEFHKLMKFPTFKSRVESKKFSVPNSFNIEAYQKAQVQNNINETYNNEEEEDKKSDKMSVKQTIKNIQKIDDLDYLNSLLESDDREKVQESIFERIDVLESKEKNR